MPYRQRMNGWQYVVKLLLDKAAADDIAKQILLALLHDGQLWLSSSFQERDA
jgi:hypothetical protein